MNIKSYSKIDVSRRGVLVLIYIKRTLDGVVEYRRNCIQVSIVTNSIKRTNME